MGLRLGRPVMYVKGGDKGVVYGTVLCICGGCEELLVSRLFLVSWTAWGGISWPG
jgi:hypothetical protein